MLFEGEIIMNAIIFLTKEHNKVRRTLADIIKKSHRYTTKKKMFSALCKDLITHENMEQKIWYPHFKKNKKLKNEVKHLLSEEKHAEKSIKKLKSIKTQEEWEEKFSKFKKSVEQHAYEEEHDLFPNVKRILDKSELEDIGKEMRKFKSKSKNTVSRG